ncbi:hypothetical protein SEPCBS119000_002695 [Sporothrix epigloea]|uniref:Zn(2)-C6 fungal-type domain-containing protein n=1 Tax=Sporothrix epigloea TaxID=1892477 RepID=A0ABP0DLP9_9PEZI
MSSLPSDIQKHACSTCARRKIRCDRRQPCSNCVAQARIVNKKRRSRDGIVKGQDQDPGCVYVEPLPAQRNRRKAVRAASSAQTDGLLDRLQVYKDLLQKNGIALPEAREETESDCRRHASQELLSHDASEDGDGQTMVDERIWIASPWEDKMARRPGPTPTTTAETPSSGADTLAVSESVTDKSGSTPFVLHTEAADDELKLWQSMPPELRNPPVSSVFARRFFNQKTSAERAAEETAVALDHTTPLPIAYSILGTTSPVPIQHPEPRMILYLWQTFVDNVNPFMRIVHVPTMHQQIVDASWDAAHAPPTTGALLFAIYALALTSMTAQAYANMIASIHTGPAKQSAQPLPPKSQLLTQYRHGAMQCLAEAGLLTTRRIDVLQAFTLLILTETDSELASTLASIAVHLGQKMNLHREARRLSSDMDQGSAWDSGGGASHSATAPRLSLFEREMSVRLWWQIRGIEARMRQAVSLRYAHNPGNAGHGCGNFFGSDLLPPPELVSMRMPLNVNDADLHPAMTCVPVEHTGLTEMLYLRVKYHTVLWMQAFARKNFLSGHSAATASVATPAGHLFRTQLLPDLKSRAVDELDQLYLEICHRHADPRIPLHAVSSGMARMAVAKLRFQAYHPRTTAVQPPLPAATATATATTGGRGYVAPAFSQHNADAAFRHALALLESCFGCQQVPSIGKSFAALQLLADVVMRVIVDAVVYLVCMLRIRTGGDEAQDEASVVSAWLVVEFFWGEYGEDLDAAANDFEQHILDLSTQQNQPPLANSRGEADDESRKLAAGATFVSAFTDLTLEAWNAREQVLRLRGPGPNSTPDFITKLRAKIAAQQMTAEVPLAAVAGWDNALYQEELVTDWGYWNSILQI